VLTPKVSIIVPTINKNDHLLTSFRSLINDNQFYEHEVIVVDDSIQGLLPDQVEYLRGFKNVSVVRSQARSASGARDIGIRSARGEFISFLDDDDIFAPNRISGLLEFMSSVEGTKYSFATTRRAIMKDDMRSISLPDSQPCGEIYLDSLFYYNHVDIGIFFKRDLYYQIGGFDLTMNGLEDWDLIIRLCKVAPGYRLENFKYFVTDDDVPTRVSNTQERARYHIAEKYRSYFGEDWYSKFYAIALYINRELEFKPALLLSLKGHSLSPLVFCIKSMIKRVFLKK
jgi:glycosyltransferase involved in cell wall biosynthesis